MNLLLIVILLGQPQPHTVRIFAGEYAGSGVLVSEDQVLTNWHVVKSGGPFRVLFPSWTVVKAEVIKVDRNWDLALLGLRRKVIVKSVGYGEKVEIGDTVTIGGYGRGWFESKTGVVKQISDYWFRVDVGARDGDSGSPVLKDGKLIGILFGTDFSGAHGTRIKIIKEFLNE